MFKKEIVATGRYFIEVSPVEFIKLQCFVDFALHNLDVANRSETMDSWVSVAKSFVAL